MAIKKYMQFNALPAKIRLPSVLTALYLNQKYTFTIPLNNYNKYFDISIFSI